jgi:hypothetical protein
MGVLFYKALACISFPLLSGPFFVKQNVRMILLYYDKSMTITCENFRRKDYRKLSQQS